MLGFVLFLVGAALIAPEPRPFEVRPQAPAVYDASAARRPDLPARFQHLFDGYFHGRLSEVQLDFALQRDGVADTTELLALARAARAHGIAVSVGTAADSASGR